VTQKGCQELDLPAGLEQRDAPAACPQTAIPAEANMTLPGSRRTGVANLPLHHGKAPRWLFERRVKLAREITIVIVADFGPDEMLHRLSHPFWFQAFG